MFDLSVYRTIDSVRDINSAAFVVYEDDDEIAVRNIVNCLGSGPIGCYYSVLSDNEETLDFCAKYFPDIVLVFSCGSPGLERQFFLCRQLRESGFGGMVLLVSDGEAECGLTQHVTGEGFDNYFFLSDGPNRVLDAVQWAIINRRRRNKHTIQFDHNPDMFLTVDRKGRVYDLNSEAVKGLGISPRDVVRNNVNATELATFRFFQDIVRPLVTSDNIGKSFSITLDEVDAIYQVNTKIHNVSTIGVVATVVKTDITRTMYSRTMDILVNSITLLSQRDNYTAAHSSRVLYYCMLIAEELGLSRQRKFIRAMNFAALLHDIGKIGIKDSVLLKPGKLTAEEFDELASHPIKGYEMLQSYSFLREAGELVLSHHERLDGSGYPDNLTGDGIPLGSAIISVADGFDAMTSCRPYRSALSFEAAVKEVRDNIGTQYHPDVGKAFLSRISPQMLRFTRETSRKPLGVLTREVLDSILGEPE